MDGRGGTPCGPPCIEGGENCGAMRNGTSFLGSSGSLLINSSLPISATVVGAGSRSFFRLTWTSYPTPASGVTVFAAKGPETMRASRSVKSVLRLLTRITRSAAGPCFGEK